MSATLIPPGLLGSGNRISALRVWFPFLYGLELSASGTDFPHRSGSGLFLSPAALPTVTHLVRLLHRAILIRRRTSFSEYPVAVHDPGGNERRWSTNTGFDSDYLPPVSFVHRSVGSVQDGKLSSPPDSADRIHWFPPFHPFTGSVVRIRRPSHRYRVRESSASTRGHSPFPPVPD